MFDAHVSQQIKTASQVHVALLDEFIRVTKEKLDGHEDIFVRDSLADLLSSLRDERDGYTRLTDTRTLASAA
ncbi:hypothetical protein [Azospirillum halopraeferens]|uniref:hypothetical protein n=1 Tax=Azospirillum halopraeferens TaxID=34010 RepID=UPI0003FC9367|nr:hypothetical protein [Azospirillum halopraeferens]